MKKALILYNSRTGTTKNLGEDIHKFLIDHNISSQVFAIDEITNFDFPGINYIFLGCWTSGLLFFMQKPEKRWIEFAKRLPVMNGDNLALFTTYKIRTGSMFRNMKKHIKSSGNNHDFFEIKSRNGWLPENSEAKLLELISN